MEGGRPPIQPEREDEDRRLVEAYNELGPILPMPEEAAPPSPEILAERDRIHASNEKRQSAARVINAELESLSCKLAAKEGIADEFRKEIANTYLMRLVNNPPGTDPRRRADTVKAVRGTMYNALRNGWRDRLRRNRPLDVDGETRLRGVSIDELQEKGDVWESGIVDSGLHTSGRDAFEQVAASRVMEALQEVAETVIEELAEGMGDKAAATFRRGLDERYDLFSGAQTMAGQIERELAADTGQPTREAVTQRIQQRHSRVLKRLWDETERRLGQGSITATQAEVMKKFIGALRLRKSDKDA